MRNEPSGDTALRVLLEPGRSGEENMRRDRDLLREQSPDAGPALRFYTWSPWCISLGSMQRPEDLIDGDACRAAGIDVVQRPTGGRAILHAEEITYAVVASTHDARFGRSLGASHERIGRALAAGLARLGVPTALSRPALDPERRLVRQPCFASPGRAELLVGGRKLLGSAQRRLPHAFLQHGSLLLGPAHERLVDFLQDARDPERAAAMRQHLRRDTVVLGELLRPVPSFATLVEALVAGFESTLGLQAQRVRLDAAQAPPPAPADRTAVPPASTAF